MLVISPHTAISESISLIGHAVKKPHAKMSRGKTPTKALNRRSNPPTFSSKNIFFKSIGPPSTTTCPYPILKDTVTIRSLVGGHRISYRRGYPNESMLLTVRANVLLMDFRWLLTCLALSTCVSAAGDGGFPVIKSIYGPKAVERSLSPEHLLDYGVKVEGGTPPYTYLWHGDPGKIICQGPQCAEIKASSTQLRSNGEGLWVWVSVTDSAGEGAVWEDDTGRRHSEFTYGVKYEQGGVITEPKTFPYKMPAAPKRTATTQVQLSEDSAEQTIDVQYNMTLRPASELAPKPQPRDDGLRCLPFLNGLLAVATAWAVKTIT
jgi:hypothetical protein